MEPFRQLTAIAAPLRRVNIDTDAIIPSREMKRVSKDGLGDGLFAGWRYESGSGRTENPEFVLNQTPYRVAKILLTGDNFGCGSSREHAVWALKEWGIRCIIAPSFGAIFAANCIRNGLLPLVLDDTGVAAITAYVEAAPKTNQVNVDLQAKTLSAGEYSFEFELSDADQRMLLDGLDSIALTLQHTDEITAFEQRDRAARSWAIVTQT